MNCQDKLRCHFKKQILENGVKHQILQIIHITSKNSKTEYRRSTEKYVLFFMYPPVFVL